MKVDLHNLRGTVAELTSLLDQAHASDKVAEEKKSASQTQGACGCFIAIFAGFGSFVMLAEANGDPVGYLALLVLVVSVVVAIRGFTQANHFAQFDLDDRKLETVRSLIQYLEADLAPQAEVRSMVDFRPVQEQRFRTESGTDGSTFYGPITTSSYSQTWLDFQVRLVDRTSLRIVIDRSSKRKVKPKKKGRRKVKDRSLDVVKIQVRTAAGRYPDLSGVENFLGETPEGFRLRQFQGEGDTVKLVCTTPFESKLSYRGQEIVQREGLVEGHKVLGLVVCLFRALKAHKASSIG